MSANGMPFGGTRRGRLIHPVDRRRARGRRARYRAAGKSKIPLAVNQKPGSLPIEP
jgi:hypothetical protein